MRDDDDDEGDDEGARVRIVLARDQSLRRERRPVAVEATTHDDTRRHTTARPVRPGDDATALETGRANDGI